MLSLNVLCCAVSSCILLCCVVLYQMGWSLHYFHRFNVVVVSVVSFNALYQMRVWEHSSKYCVVLSYIFWCLEMCLLEFCPEL